MNPHVDVKGTSIGIDKAACWERALQKAKEHAALMYPAHAVKQRREMAERLAVRYYAQMVSP